MKVPFDKHLNQFNPELNFEEDWVFEDDDESILDVMDSFSDLDWSDLNDDSDIYDEYGS